MFGGIEGSSELSKVTMPNTLIKRIGRLTRILHILPLHHWGHAKARLTENGNEEETQPKHVFFDPKISKVKHDILFLSTTGCQSLHTC
jgi:hypothetical protein